MSVFALLVAAFVAGAVPFGAMIARRRGVDLRSRGSGNIGATNAARVLGAGAGAMVLVLDAAKGALPVLLAASLELAPWSVAAIGAAAIAGHCFSPFLGWRGGKGVATSFGVFLVLAPLWAGVAVVVFASVLAITRVPALGSLAGVGCVAALAVASGDVPRAALAVATTALLVFTHRENLARLRATR